MNESPVWKAEFPYQSKSIQIDGLRYAYVDQGPAGESQKGSQPIVAVHGNPTWSFYWRRLFGDVSAGPSESKSEQRLGNRRVLAVDHIGCGRSDKPQRYEYTLARHRDNLLTWIDRLGLSEITLVVHDWGGAIGLAAAVQRPDLFSRLIVTNTGAFPPPYIPLRISACRIPLLGTLAVRGFNAFAGAAIRMATHRYAKLPEAAAAGLLAPYDSWRNRVAIDRFVKDIPARKSHPSYQVLVDLESKLPLLDEKPILLVWGMRDWCFRPECLRRFQHHWPHATSVELADAGHYVMEDAPDQMLAAVEQFLEQN